jgi:hypothetical protein
LRDQAELLKLQRPTKKNKAKLLELEKEMKPLIEFLDDAKRQRAAIKAEVGKLNCYRVFRCSLIDNLKNSADSCVLVLDFTKWGMIDEGNLHCLVIAMLTGRAAADSSDAGIRCLRSVNSLNL